MQGINKVIIIGHVGDNPEIRYTQSGNCIANLSLATNESWTDKHTGNKQVRTEWHRVVLFEKIAEVVSQYVKKGALLYIEGKIQTQKYQDKQTGQDRYSTQIVVSGPNSKMSILNSKEETKAGQAPAASAQQYQATPQQQAQQFQAPPPQQQQGYPPAQQNSYAQARQQPVSQATQAQQPFQDDDVPF